MVPLNQQHYPDIYDPVPPEEQGKKDSPTKKKNQQSRILYLAVRHLLRRLFDFDPQNCTTDKSEEFPQGYGRTVKGGPIDKDIAFADTVRVAGIMGYLRAHGFDDPSLGKAPLGAAQPKPERAVMLFDPKLVGGEIAFESVQADENDAIARKGPNDIVLGRNHPDSDKHVILIAGRFIAQFTKAVANHNTNRGLYQAVFQVLQDEGTHLDATGKKQVTIRTRQLAEVTQRLVDDRVEADDPHLTLRVTNALTQSIGGFIEGAASDFDIDLPNLDAGTDVEIDRNNVRAVAAIYFSAMLEELGLYAVMEKVAEHFMIGMVPISRGPASDKIYKWIKDADDRFTEIERRGVYGRVLGLAQGAATDVLPNREFSDLWFRFLSTVSVLDRERRSTTLLHVSGEQALKAARDVSVNMSLHGYGIAHPAAVEMQTLIGDIRDILAEPELHTAYGVRDIWQLVDRVNSMYLGGYVNGVRYRTMAMSGGEIILWLADNSVKLDSVTRAGEADFGNATLVSNVERWLAVTGTPDASVEQFTDPVDLQSQPTVPGFAPTNGASPVAQSPIIREALDQAGIDTLPAIPQI